MDDFVGKKIKTRGFKPGDDVILMVMNTGEVDLFLILLFMQVSWYTIG